VAFNSLKRSDLAVKNFLKGGNMYQLSPHYGAMTKFEYVSIKSGNIFFKTADDLRKFNSAMVLVKPMMQISGIAGIILGVMDVLFTVGYSIAITVISDDVNDMLAELTK
jgi:hypothetical protein